jgi:hypothetical protein
VSPAYVVHVPQLARQRWRVAWSTLRSVGLDHWDERVGLVFPAMRPFYAAAADALYERAQPDETDRIGLVKWQALP